MSIRTSLACCVSAVALVGIAACIKKDKGNEPPAPAALVLVPAPLPKTTGAYLRVAAADKLLAGTAELPDIREGVEFDATRVLLQWPLENETGDWRQASDGGLEMKRGNAFQPLVWQTGSNGVVTTDALADSEGIGLIDLTSAARTAVT